MNKLILTCFMIANSVLLLSQTMVKPDVYIITTGGTIASKTNAPLIDGPALVQTIPELLDYANIEVEEFVRIGSSKMTPKIWLSLLKRIQAIIVKNPKIRCIVVTHGTDTMEETAFFLNLTHRSSIPIIIVGSMRSSNEISADGPANLLNAVRVGVSEETAGKGVLVVMNENIQAARDLQKMHNRRVDAFPSTERGYLGSVDPESVIFYRTPSRTHTSQSEFDVYELDSLPPIDILQDFAGFDQEILEYFMDRPTQGLVISTFAGGRMSSAMSEINKSDPAGKPVVIASSIKGGRISGANQDGTPIVISNDLPANKARILLMLALTRTSDPKEIQAIFHKY